jgi:hypothetical protein
MFTKGAATPRAAGVPRLLWIGDHGYWPDANRSLNSFTLDTFESVGRPRMCSIDFVSEPCE